MSIYDVNTIEPYRPKNPKWKAIRDHHDPKANGKVWVHPRGFSVISTVETARDQDGLTATYYHLSVARQSSIGPLRSTKNEAAWAMRQFGMEPAEADEDNHVPYGKVRNFWRPVDDTLVGHSCPCKETELAIVEGDYTWRTAPGMTGLR